MYKFMTIVTALFIAAPVHAQSVGERSGVNAAIGVSPSTQDFVTQVAIGDMLEIESGKLAEQKATEAGTKSFARQLVTDHQKTTAELKGLVSSGKVKATLPTANWISSRA